MHPRELWESRAIGARAVRGALIPAAFLYGLGWEAYVAAYRLGLKRACEPHRPVVCVGNLTVGGSGKTPVTLHIAEVLRSLGREVVIGCSGYGAPHAEGAALTPVGPLSPREWGDEPAMVRACLPDLPLVVGRRRVLAAELVHARHPDAVLLMDDGFQHLPLRKHVALLLDDPAPENAWCLPAGPYREPRRNRARADVVIPGRFRLETDPLRFATPTAESSAAPKAFSVLCALGNPERFLAALREATGAEPSPAILLPDHDPLRAGTLWERLPAERPVVVTAKDWVKLRERPDVGTREILIAIQSVRIEPAAEFRAWIGEKLDGQAP